MAASLTSSCSNDPLTFGNLQFYDNDGHQLEAKFTQPFQTYEWEGFTTDYPPNVPVAPDALSAPLVNQPIEQTGCGNAGVPTCGVNVAFNADDDSLEADVFVVDPSILTAFLEPTGCGGGDMCPTAPMATFAQAITPSTMPPALALPSSPLAKTQTTPLTSEMFYGNVQPANVLAGGTLFNNDFGGLGVQGVRVYDHGGCSLGIGWQIPAAVKSGQTTVAPLLPQIDETVWTSFAQLVNGCGGGDQHTAHMDLLQSLAYLEHTSGDPMMGVGGGFLLAGHVDIATIGDTDVYFFAKYPLALTPSNPAINDFGGLLTITSPEVYVQAVGAYHGTVLGLATPAFTTTLPQKFGEAAFSVQSKDILAPIVQALPLFAADRACTVADKNPCQRAESLLDQVISDGAVAALGSISEVAQLTRAAGAINLSTGALNNWQCVPNNATGGNDGQGVCEYIVRAKRLNIFPDQIELVWFDFEELDNPTYALWIALHAPYVPSSSSTSLCAAPLLSSNTMRAFGTDTLPVAPGTAASTVPCP